MQTDGARILGGETGAALAIRREEITRARSRARAWSEMFDDDRRVDQAALFSRAALQAYAAISAPALVLSQPFKIPNGRLDIAASLLAREIGRLACGLSQTEALDLLSGLYAALLPKARRGVFGAYYTPAALADRLLDLAAENGVDWGAARVLDPAAGGGAFLIRAAARIRAAMSRKAPAFILARLPDRLAGLELDPHAASLSQTSLEILLADITAACGSPLPILVKVVDTLEEPPGADFDLVVGNPPYGRIALTPNQRARFARGLYGHANLYSVFTDVALRWTRPGGMIAYLTPTSFLGGQYYAALRGLLAKEAPPVAIDFVHARSGVFEDVLQETLLAIYRRGGAPGPFSVHHLTVTDARAARVSRNGAIRLPCDPAAPWLAPRDPAHAALISRAERMPSRLADWGYEVSTGPLVWNRYKPQICDLPEPGAYPLLWAEAVTPDGLFIHRAEKRGHAPYFRVGPGDRWMVTYDACVLVQRTTAKEQARRLIAAALPSAFVKRHGGVVIENHLNMVRPVGEPAVPSAAVAALLNSDIVDSLFRCISGSVAVSAFELRSLPIPDAAAMRPIEQLLARGADRRTVESAIARLYGDTAA